MARVTIQKQLGNASMMSEFIAKMAQEKMVEMVEKTVETATTKDWLPFNLKVYVQQGGNFDPLNDIVKLGIKVDAIYMGSSWGLLKIVFMDFLNQKKYQIKNRWRLLMIKIGIIKEEDWE